MQGRCGNRRSRYPLRALHCQNVAALQRCNHQRGVGCGSPPHAEPPLMGASTPAGYLRHGVRLSRSGGAARLHRCFRERDASPASTIATFPYRSTCGPAHFFGTAAKPRSRFAGSTILWLGGFKRPSDNSTARPAACPRRGHGHCRVRRRSNRVRASAELPASNRCRKTREHKGARHG